MRRAGDPTRRSALAEARGQEAAPLRFSNDTPGVPLARHSRSAHPIRKLAPSRIPPTCKDYRAMSAETVSLNEQIRQSVALLRRHL